jgi:hypothetical protein
MGTRKDTRLMLIYSIHLMLIYSIHLMLIISVVPLKYVFMIQGIFSFQLHGWYGTIWSHDTYHIWLVLLSIYNLPPLL